MPKIPFSQRPHAPKTHSWTTRWLASALAALILAALGLWQPTAAHAALPNGVAAGDVQQRKVVLWTHSDTVGDVTFELSLDADFANILETRTARVEEPLQPVKVAIGTLVANTRYYYRATDSAGASAEGRFRTPQWPTAASGLLRFGAGGEWQGGLAPFPVFNFATADRPGGHDLDFFVALGNTVDASLPSPAVPEAARSLEDFRRKHAEVYSGDTNALRNLRQSTAWFATLDEHELFDNFAGGAPVFSDPRFANLDPDLLVNDALLYERAALALQEYNPLFNWRYPPPLTSDERSSGERKLYRYREFGDLAAIFVLDGRSFRDQNLPQPPLNAPAQEALFRAAADDPTRTLLGRTQLDELKTRLRLAQAEGITWKFIFLPQPIQNLGTYGAADRYEGFAAERDDLLGFIDRAFITNVVFVSGGQQGTLVNNLTYRPTLDGPQISSGAFEVVTGPVASNTLFGPQLVEQAIARGLLPAEAEAEYLAMPRFEKNAFVKQLLDDMLAAGLSNGSEDGYDPLGLEDSGLQVSSVTGTEAWISAHSFGWTEFSIHPETRNLLVNHHIVDPYTEADVTADPDAVAALEPGIVGQFQVTPVDFAAPEASKLYLFDDRFEVSATYVDNRGLRQVATPFSIGRRAGWFSFRNPQQQNPELVVKMLDGRALTGSHWIFIASLSSLEFQVVVRDRLLGEERVFENPRGRLQSFVDLRPFPQKAGSPTLLEPFGTDAPLDTLLTELPDSSPEPLLSDSALTARSSEACVSDGQGQICLLDRIQVTIDFGTGGPAPGALPNLRSQIFSRAGGYYWLRHQDTPEVAVKALNSNNGYYWLFVGGLTNRPFTVTFEDVFLGTSASYTNPGGTLTSVLLPRALASQ